MSQGSTASRIDALLRQLARLLQSLEREAGAGYGLEPVHLAVLAYLRSANRYSDRAGAVADYLGVTKGTASQSIRRLVERGLVEQVADADDRRVVRLRLSPAGSRVVDDLAPAPAVRSAIEELGVDAAELARLLTRLLAGLQRANDRVGFGVCSTCRHFQSQGRAFRCGLTGEALSVDDSRRICREHRWPGAPAIAAGAGR
jgi:MarR family transcriptional regulator, negative regulator of the multidrug operon emrRAB